MLKLFYLFHNAFYVLMGSFILNEDSHFARQAVKFLTLIKYHKSPRLSSTICVTASEKAEH